MDNLQDSDVSKPTSRRRQDRAYTVRLTTEQADKVAADAATVRLSVNSYILTKLGFELPPHVSNYKPRGRKPGFWKPGRKLLTASPESDRPAAENKDDLSNNNDGRPAVRGAD